MVLEAQQIGRRQRSGAQWLLRDVSLTIQASQRLAVVGPTGSGKTLLLRALALLDPLDSGQILWNGRPVAAHHVPAFRSRVIYLHQRPAILSGSVEDNLRQPFLLKVHDEQHFDRNRVLRLLRDIGRDDDFLARAGRNLSGGERQLTALLRAIQLDPEVLLLDEPTAALDATTATAVEHLVQHWQRGGARSFVWVSHQSSQVERIADQVWTMRSGRLSEER